MIIHEQPHNTLNLKTGVGTSYGNGLNKLSKYFFQLLMVMVVVFLFGIPSILAGILEYRDIAFIAVNVILYIYSFFVTTPLEYGVSYAFLKAARDEQPSVNDLSVVLKNYWNIVLANILVSVIVMVGLFLFIIPGIYFAIKLFFVRYLVVDRNMAPLQAIDESWRMTAGYGGTIFLMVLLAIPIVFAGILFFGIGVIFSVMWIETAFASLYHAVSLEKQMVSVEPPPAQQGPFV